MKFVQWCAANCLFIGYCPDLFIGGVCHGSDEQNVYRHLSQLVAEEIAESERAHRALPTKCALVTVPGRRARNGRDVVALKVDSWGG